VSGTFSTLLTNLPASASEGSFHVLQLPGCPAYYAGRDASGTATPLIRTTGTGRTVPLALAGIEARFSMACRVAEPGGSERTESLTAILCLSRDVGVEEYFAHVVDLLVSVLGPAPSVATVAAAINELVDLFQKLRRPPRKPIMGLVGELLVIACAADPQAAVAAWRRDPDERYDFAVGELRVEAKTSSRAARVHFLSAEQADPPPGIVGLLASSFVEQAGGGSSLEHILNLIEAKLLGHAEVVRLRSIVADTLGRDLPAALSWSFDLASALSSLAFFDLRAIPAIRGPLPAGVSSVRFTVDLAGISPVSAGILTTVGVTARKILPP
jgi:Putative  PD-(D/E)XK family member, (DUF4420)